MAMSLRGILTAGAVTALAISTLQLTSASAYSGTCRPSGLGTPNILGEVRYSCPDGSYTLKKPPLTSSWNDPFATYELRPNYGGFGAPRAKCKYQSLTNSYKCR